MMLGVYIAYDEKFSHNESFLYVQNTTRLVDKFEIKICFAAIMIILCLVTTIGNISVIYRYRKASMVGNLFIISLATADLIVGSFVMPLASIYALTNVWTMSLTVCQIWLIADYTASTASILNLLTLSIDRYWSITSPLKYLGKRTKSRALLMISVAWFVSLLWIFPITGWAYFINDNVRYVPENKCDTEYNKNIILKVSTAIFNFYIPLITMICINTKIYLVIRKRYQNPIMKYTSSAPSNEIPLKLYNFETMGRKINSRRFTINYNQRNSNSNSKKFGKKFYSKSLKELKKSDQNNNNNHDLTKKTVRQKFLNVNNENSVIIKNNESKSSPKEKNSHENKKLTDTFSSNEMTYDSNGNNRRFKSRKIRGQEKHFNKQEKAFKQLIAIVTGFTFCFLPYFIVFLIVALCEDCVSEQVYTFTIWLGYLNSAINPFLYALSNRSIKHSNKRKNLRNQNFITSNNENMSSVYSRRSRSERQSFKKDIK